MQAESQAQAETHTQAPASSITLHESFNVPWLLFKGRNRLWTSYQDALPVNENQFEVPGTWSLLDSLKNNSIGLKHLW